MKRVLPCTTNYNGKETFCLNSTVLPLLQTFTVDGCKSSSCLVAKLDKMLSHVKGEGDNYEISVYCLRKINASIFFKKDYAYKLLSLLVYASKILDISKIQLVVYYQYCVLIG